MLHSPKPWYGPATGHVTRRAATLPRTTRHSTLSYGHAKKLEKRLKREVQELLKLAERADAADIPDGMSIPEELERREARLVAIAEAKKKIEARVAEREQT